MAVPVVTGSAFNQLLEENLEQRDIDSWLSQTDGRLRAFLDDARENGRRVVLLTSGGTAVPLERNAVRFVTNFSTGGRGSKMAEVFIEAGWSVVFLYRKGSLLPYHRVLQSAESPLDAIDSPAVQSALEAYRRHSCRLFNVQYETVMQYLYRLRHLATVVNTSAATENTRCPFVVLAAAVSDYYIPASEMSQHKMSGADADGGLTLAFKQVPKALGLLRHDWAPQCVVVSFKLETDPDALEHKALKNLHAYANGAVVANLLQSYTTHATIYYAMPNHQHEVAKVSSDGTGVAMERAIVESLLGHFAS